MSWLLTAICVVFLVFGIVVVRGAPYVPSHRRFARLALTKLYKLREGDVLVDLGSGDGIILRIATSLSGATAIGYELNPVLVFISRVLARGNPRIQTRLGDMWRVELPEDTTVVYVFAVTRDIPKLEKRLQQEADRLGHSFHLITYGSPLQTKEPLRRLHAHTLYLFEP